MKWSRFSTLRALRLPLLRLLPPQLFRHRPVHLASKAFSRRLWTASIRWVAFPVRPDGHTLHDAPELLDQFLLPDGLPLLGAGPLTARAMVADIPGTRSNPIGGNYPRRISKGSRVNTIAASMAFSPTPVKGISLTERPGLANSVARVMPHSSLWPMVRNWRRRDIPN